MFKVPKGQTANVYEGIALQVIDWQRVVDKYSLTVWQNAYRLLGNHSDTVDCFSQTFTLALEISQRKYIRNIHALLVHLVTTCAIDRLGRRYRHAQLHEEAVDLIFVPSDSSDSAQQIQAQDLAGRLRKTLGQLPPQEAEIFCLHYINGMSYRQIARELGIKSNTAGVLSHKARLELGNILGNEPDKSEAGTITEKNKDILNDFISALKKERVLTRPTSENIDSALAKLSQATGGEMKTANKPITFIETVAAVSVTAKIVAVLIVIAIAIGITVYTSQKVTEETVKPQIKDVLKKTGDKQLQAKLDVELNKIERMFIARDIKGLLAILNTGQLETRVAAANYLAEIGDTKVLAALDKSARRYEGPDNPFAAALKKINTRLQPTPIKAPQKPAPKPKELPVEKIIHGWLIDANDNPVAGEIQLGGTKILTDEEGAFTVSEPSNDEFGEVFATAFSKKPTLGIFFIWNETYDVNNAEIVVKPLASVTGFVTDRQGNPVSDYELKLSVYVQDDILYNGSIGEQIPEIQIRPNGSFDINSIPTGVPLGLIVSRTDYKTIVKLEGLTAGKLLDVGQIVLESPEALTEKTVWDCIFKGFVLNEANEPIAGAIVNAYAGDDRFETIADGNGWFELTELPTHTRIGIVVQAKGYGHNTFNFECIEPVNERDVQIFPPGYDWFGKEAPGLFVERWLNTEPLTLEQLTGQVVLLRIDNYLAETASVSRLLQIYEKYAAEPLTIIAIHSPSSMTPDTKQRLEQFVTENAIDFPFGVDAAADIVERMLPPRDRAWDDNLIRVGRMGLRLEGAMYSLYEAKSLPACYLIDKNGVLRAAPAEDILEEWIELLLSSN